MSRSNVVYIVSHLGCVDRRKVVLLFYGLSSIFTTELQKIGTIEWTARALEVRFDLTDKKTAKDDDNEWEVSHSLIIVLVLASLSLINDFAVFDVALLGISFRFAASVWSCLKYWLQDYYEYKQGVRILV